MKRMIDFLLFLVGIQRQEKIEKIANDYRPSVSVLIPAYNEEKTIEATIKSIQAQTYPISEIIVVDDSSTDRTGEIAKNLGVKVVRTPKNSGTKVRAQNFGLQFVETEVVVTVDADTILDPKAIELILPALADGKTLSVCGFVIPQELRTFWEKARLIQYLYYIGLPKSAQAHWGVPIVSSGCFSAFNTQLLKEMKGFPEKTMAEDMMLTWKAHLEGKKVKFIPEAVCYPKDPSNWRQYKAQMLRWNRGFLECIKEYKLALRHNFRLFFFVAWYLFSGILTPFLWISFFAYLIWFLFSHPQGTVFLLVFWGLLLEMTIVFFTVLLGGVKYKCLKPALLYFPFYWAISPIDAYLFCNALIQEWVLGRTLQKWEKGH